MTTDENQKQRDPSASDNNDRRKPGLHSSEAMGLQHKIAALLAQVDQEAEQFRHRVAEILRQARALRSTIDGMETQNDLVLQLREANQNLVIAALNAQDMQAKAESAHHRQQEFLSMLAHELRNPLAPIAMATELLETVTAAHPLLPKVHGIISRQVNHMTRLVDDLMEASRVNSGKITLQKRAIMLSEVIDNAIETSRPFIDKRSQQLAIALPDRPVFIDGDLVRLTQVFLNLLINATKFTPEHGHIRISAQQSADAVTVSIKDNGVGIPMNLQPFIFDLFTQGPGSLDRSLGGLGIGLSLVRTIVDLHGGTVNVHSAGAGFGSEFTVVLPNTAMETPPMVGSSPSAITRCNPCRILIIEDSVDANEIMSNLLTLAGHTIASALDGTSGLAMAKENRYDVIICDIGLPGINGYELIGQLRDHGLESMPWLIATTGYNQRELRDRAMEAGFDHYLVKPIAMETLMQLISSRAPQ